MLTSLLIDIGLMMLYSVNRHRIIFIEEIDVQNENSTSVPEVPIYCISDYQRILKMCRRSQYNTEMPSYTLYDYHSLLKVAWAKFGDHQVVFEEFLSAAKVLDFEILEKFLIKNTVTGTVLWERYERYRKATNVPDKYDFISFITTDIS